MFKRQFYALEHSNAGHSASSSSSSSLATASDGEHDRDVEDDAATPASDREMDETSEEEVVEAEGATSATRIVPTFGNSFEDIRQGSDSEADAETSDVEPGESQNKSFSNQWAEAVDEDEDERVPGRFDGSTVILKGSSNQVLKCRVCPKVLCLSEESMKAHLASKGHARALKQLSNGTLKVQLDSDGEEEEEGETHAERYSRTVLTADEEKTVKRNRDSGRQRQRKRLKRKALLATKDITIDSKVSRAQLAAKEVGRENLVSTSTKGKQSVGKLTGKKDKTDLILPARKSTVNGKVLAHNGQQKSETKKVVNQGIVPKGQLKREKKASKIREDRSQSVKQKGGLLGTAV